MLFSPLSVSIAIRIAHKALKALSLVAFIVGAISPAHAKFPETDLRSYYLDYPWWGTSSQPGITSTRPFAELRPRVAITGGGLEPFYVSIGPSGQRIETPIERPYVPGASLLGFFPVTDNGTTRTYAYREGVCNGYLAGLVAPVAGTSTTQAANLWYGDNANGVRSGVIGQGLCDTFLSRPPWPSRVTRDELTYAAPIRRVAIDGGQYDASPMALRRNGVPWYTHYFGYHLGLVANESNWSDANASAAGDVVGFFTLPSPVNNFNLAALPPPWVEDEVVEYVNRANFPLQPGGQYFYAVRADDKTLLDSIPAWQRSGKSFKSGGYVSVCRFYGGKNGGPNTHFYSADDKECALLKTIPQLSYEGQTFAVNMPLPGANADGSKPCPIDSKPLYRVYNNAAASNGRFVSNHRYFTERADVAAVVAQGWLDEGQVMCVPM